VLQVICCRHLLLELYASCCWDSLFVRYWSLHALYLQVFISFMYMHLIFVTELYCHVPDKSVPSGFFLTLVCISFHLLTLCHRMVVVSYSPLHLLELVACHYRLSYHAYLREVGGDGSVLAWRRGAWDCSVFLGVLHHLVHHAHLRNRPCKPFASYSIRMGLWYMISVTRVCRPIGTSHVLLLFMQCQ
jgi:hypothetical protein